MKRRKFLLTSGSAVLGSATLHSLSQKPTIALDFQVNDYLGVKPSSIESILLEFNKFQLIPKYIDETGNPATIEIKATTEEDNQNKKTSQIKLLNNQKINDPKSLNSIIIDGIQTDKSILEVDVEISIEHPNISRLYNQSFIITDSKIHDSLSAWWPLNDQNGDATEIVNSYNATLNGGGITRGSDKISDINSYYFDATSYLDAGNKPEYRPKDGGFTAMLWFKTDENKDYQNDYRFPRILTTAPSSPYRNSDGWTITISRQNLLGIFNDGTQESAVKLRGPEVSDANWHHVALTFAKDDTVEMYLDGDIVSRDSYTRQVDQGHPLTVGASANYGNYYPGNVADIRIYQKTLTSKEIKTVYNRGDVGSIQDSVNQFTN